MGNTSFFDAHLVWDSTLAFEPPEGLRGAVAFGADAAARCSFLRGAALNWVVGPNDPRYPKDADVIALRMDDAALVKHLKEPPAHWWPLCGSPRTHGEALILQVSSDDFSSLAKGLARLVRAFPAVRLIVEPFLKGKNSNWKAGVCLAEEPNVWVTTRGLYAAADAWPERSEREAMHFVIGEVGASKLLFASGLNATQWRGQRETPAEWLSGIPFLDAAQHALILRENAGDVFDAHAMNAMTATTLMSLSSDTRSEVTP